MSARLRLPRGTYITDEGEIFRARKLTSQGRSSKVLVIPKGWCDVFAKEAWVEIDYTENAEWVIRPLSEEKLEAVKNERK